VHEPITGRYDDEVGAAPQLLCYDGNTYFVSSDMSVRSSSQIRKVLLLHNSPRVGRYFSRLRAEIFSPEIIGCRVSGRFPRSAPPSGTVEEIVDYGMRRKRARTHYGTIRLGVSRIVYGAAARLHYEYVMAKIRRCRPDALGVWGGNAVDAKAVVVAGRDSGIPCFQFENGFLPNTTQMDIQGVNVESSVPRDPEFYVNRSSFGTREFPDRISPTTPRRGKRAWPPISLPDRYVFVPFQYHLDSQILLHSPWIQGMHQFFRIMIESARGVRGSTPALVFKEHPYCPSRYPDLLREAGTVPGVHFANGNSTDELIRNAIGVVTINSTVGTESLLLGKPVLALGNAVYEVPGVASSARSTDQVAEWLSAVWMDRAPAAPLRKSFLSFLSDDYLIPDRHQDPGPAHIRAVKERLQEPMGHSTIEG